MKTERKKKLIRATTVPTSLNTFCEGLLRELSEKYEVVALSSPGPEMAEIHEREGVRCVDVPMEWRISLKKDIVSLLRMIRMLWRERPYAIHSMTPKAGLLCMIAAWITRVPVRIHSFTGLVWPTATGLNRKILMAADWLICFCATHVLPEGEGVKADLQQVSGKQMRVLGYGNVRGIDLQHFARTEEVMACAAKIRKEGVFTFVFVGRIVRDKGMGELVEAFTRLNCEFPATRLVLVGGYEQDIDPVDAATLEAINTHPCIEAVGVQSDVRPWFAAADALVFPSYREGFPNVVIEAGAMGLPSIVTNINGSREIVIENENGNIVEPRDAEALYAAMRSYVQEPERVAAMSSKARGLVASRYEQGFVRKCLKEFYEEIL